LRFMARALQEAVGLTCAQVAHQKLSALPSSSTVDDVRAWFAASVHREMALLADDGIFVGSLTRAQVAGGSDGDRLATELAQRGPTIAPSAPADEGYQVALSTGARRVPVVDDDGRLLGVVAVTADHAGFCGTS
jgi:CBS domain-containing protein